MRVRGVIWGDLETPISIPAFYIFGVDSRERDLCVHLERINGTYNAYLEVRIDQDPATQGAVRVDFSQNTRHFETIRGLKTAQVAISVRQAQKNKDCDTEGDYFPAAWEPKVNGSLQIVLLNPSARASIMATEGSACALIGGPGSDLEGQRTTYDTVCSTLTPPLCRATREYRIRRVAISGQVLDPIVARVRGPC